ncbi:MAG: 50S ribosomal protein L13 [Candidatus Marinimicrobia bacterium]|nr:50S ribosomal protein L13 [Candidatus Neomarinimicrobiota bacterium]
MKTYSAKPSDVNHEWFVVDAKDKVLGRLASDIAQILRGKHKPIFTPHIDTGDFVVVVNADKVRVTGKKEQMKSYFSHSEYPGSTKTIFIKDLREKHPERIIINAVKGMLPHNKLGRQIIKKLKVYTGPNHPHDAQNPKKLETN